LYFFEGVGDALKARLAEAVVLVEDRDALQAQGHQLVDDGFGFVGVAGADVEHVAVVAVGRRRLADGSGP